MQTTILVNTKQQVTKTITIKRFPAQDETMVGCDCRLYVFEGAVVKADGSRDALDVANLLLRGCTLRNTDWVIGLVLFAGLDTKIFRNRVRAPRKVSSCMLLLTYGCCLATQRDSP